MRQAIDMILAQTFTDFELLVSDDASSDDTRQILAGIDDRRFSFSTNERNLNIPGNLNAPLGKAKGEYIIILHDHDIFAPNLLRACVDFLNANPSVGFVYTGIAWVDPDGSNYQVMPAPYAALTHGRHVARSILLSGSLSCPIHACGMVRRNALKAVGFGYDPKFGFLSDVDLWLRLAARFDVGYIDEPLITARRRGQDHPFVGIDWRLFAWSSDIFLKNIDLIFARDTAEYAIAKKRYNHALRSAAWRNVAAAIARGDRTALTAGLEPLRRRGLYAAHAAAWAASAIPLAVSSASQIYKVIKTARQLP